MIVHSPEKWTVSGRLRGLPAGIDRACSDPPRFLDNGKGPVLIERKIQGGRYTHTPPATPAHGMGHLLSVSDGNRATCSDALA